MDGNREAEWKESQGRRGEVVDLQFFQRFILKNTKKKRLYSLLRESSATRRAKIHARTHQRPPSKRKGREWGSEKSFKKRAK